MKDIKKEAKDKVKDKVSEKVKEMAASQAALVKGAASAQVAKVGDAAASHARLVLSDLWYIIKSDRKAQLMLVLLIVAMICWDMPYISTVLYPFKLFVTMIHESCHALAARLTGGTVSEILISPDESGLTYTKGGIFPLIASAGYPGAAFFGALLIWLGRTPKEARFVLNSLGTALLAVTIFYAGGGIFSFIAMLAISGVLILISRKASEKVCHLFLMMLAVMTTLQSLQSIQTIFLASALNWKLDVPNDAELVAHEIGIPAIAIAIFWGMISISALLFSFWISYRPKKDSAVSPNSSSAVTASPESSDIGS